MPVRNLDKLMQPKSLALIGATPRTGAVGAVVLRNLRRAGLQGPLMLVNPKHHLLDGMPVYSDVDSLPETPDLAVIVTARDEAALEEADRHPVQLLRTWSTRRR
jgi:acetyltransferase